MQIAADLGRIASALEAQNANSDAEREERDLKAQENMAIWALAQALLSAIGIALIYVTFRETRRAANSADDIVKVTRESAEKQIRAYVTLETARVVGFKLGDRPRLVSVIKNGGNSPAMKLRRRLLVGVLPDPYVARPPRFEFEFPDSSGVLGAGATIVETLLFGPDDDGFVLTQDHLDQFARREWGFWVGGWIIYEDVFKRTRRTTFRGGTTGQKPSEDGVLNLEVLARGSRMS